MKVWRCGGRIEIVPCSRVGHLFRDPSHRPYDVDVNTVVHNYKRLAELWAQDHLDYFYKMKPEAVPMKLTGMDKVIANYNELRDQLGCKDLKWLAMPLCKMGCDAAQSAAQRLPHRSVCEIISVVGAIAPLLLCGLPVIVVLQARWSVPEVRPPRSSKPIAQCHCTCLVFRDAGWGY
eukprot:g23182.t1